MRSAPHRFVCGNCFSDNGLKEYCSDHARRRRCNFCHANGSEPIAAPIEDVVAHIRDSIYRRYSSPENAGVPYESAEGGWIFKPSSTDELFEELGLEFTDEQQTLKETITNSLDNDQWAERNFYNLSAEEKNQFSWERFCNIIKHERRYFFLHQETKIDGDDDELLPPADVLKMLFSYAQRTNAFSVLSANSQFYRARHQRPDEESFTSASDLGPPPLDCATRPNRMSPAGIVMLYAAEDPSTAVAEIMRKSGTYVIAEFVGDRDLLLLDLTHLPPAPTLFTEFPDDLEEDPTPRLAFLHDVRREISKPIEDDKQGHIDYVPTQVVTEYLRTIVRIEGKSIDGIRYASSRRRGGNAIVIFADQSNLILPPEEQTYAYALGDHWLRLNKVDNVLLSDEDLKTREQTWKAKKPWKLPET